jgi:hypothetical protein
MKKLLLIILLSVALSVTAQTPQQPKDTTVQITLTLNQLRAVFAVLDQNIDSKKVSKEVLEFLQANAKMLAPTSTTEKTVEKPTPKKN